MAGILNRALQRAGLDKIAERVLRGEPPSSEEFARIAAADVLLLAGLADMVRSRFHGEDVRVLGGEAAQREENVVRVSAVTGSEAPTGQELLLEVALTRLRAPAKQSVGVSIDEFGLQLAQVALSFGADVLFGDLGSSRSLPLLDGPAARRKELDGLIARAGRRVRFEEPSRPLLTLGSPS